MSGEPLAMSDLIAISAGLGFTRTKTRIAAAMWWSRAARQSP
jgi:hypothetical protein